MTFRKKMPPLATPLLSLAAFLVPFAPVLHAASPKIVQFRTPAKADFEILESTDRSEPVQPKTIQARRIGTSLVWEFQSRLAAELSEKGSVTNLLAALPYRLSVARQVTPRLYLLEAPDAATAVAAAERLSQFDEVVSAHPVCRQPVALGNAYSTAPNDDFFSAQVANVAGQWYLENRDPLTGAALGADINIRGAWPYTLGQKMMVAIADTGIELRHSELGNATLNSLHKNFYTNSTSVGPVSGGTIGAHGTSCAGLVAAEQNNQIGMSGVAPLAGLASWVIFDNAQHIATDEHLAAMYQYASNQVAVENHSWGSADVIQQRPTPLELTGIASAWTNGRGGLGTILVRIAGNLRTQAGNANDDGWANDPRAICVSGVRPEGRAASYSNVGADILVGAPGGDYDTGGIFTTDLSGFSGANPLGFLPPYEYLSNFRFNSLGLIGTSAAAPIVSGISALVLSVNTNLTARDLQQILVLSSRHFDLSDPDLRTNAAGLKVSHNVGFGVPDAGEAVRLATFWSNRPPAVQTTLEAIGTATIPDDGLRVEVEGDGIPDELKSIHCLPGTGPHPDSPTDWLPLADAGTATNTLSASFEGRGALIERGVNDFASKLSLAAEAGAAFAVIYNYQDGPDNACPPGEQLCPLGGTDFSPIPAVFVGNAEGLGLQALFRTNATARARLAATGVSVAFNVTNQISTEHVQVRLKTDHPLRGDLRITLLSPGGTRSVLQTYNADTSAGPVDWTYMTTHDFFEEAAGIWTLTVTDEGAGNTGSILYAGLTISGTPIVDSDRDGLDDNWEKRYFGNLSANPLESPDGDGWTNLREFIQGTDPTKNDTPLALDITPWNDQAWRVSWPNNLANQSLLSYGPDAAHLTNSTVVTDPNANSVWMSYSTNSDRGLFKVTQ